jgi:hypothetical protein
MLQISLQQNLIVSPNSDKDPILSQLNPTHIVATYFRFTFNIILLVLQRCCPTDILHDVVFISYKLQSTTDIANRDFLH